MSLNNSAPRLSKRLHPGRKLWYAFDYSSTHDCRPDHTLNASILNLNPSCCPTHPPSCKEKKAAAPDGPAPVDGPAPAPTPPSRKKKVAAPVDAPEPGLVLCFLMALPPPLRLPLPLLLRGKPSKTTCALAGTDFVLNVQLISCQVHGRRPNGPYAHVACGATIAICFRSPGAASAMSQQRLDVDPNNLLALNMLDLTLYQHCIWTYACEIS